MDHLNIYQMCKLCIYYQQILDCRYNFHMNHMNLMFDQHHNYKLIEFQSICIFCFVLVFLSSFKEIEEEGKKKEKPTVAISSIISSITLVALSSCESCVTRTNSWWWTWGCCWSQCWTITGYIPFQMDKIRKIWIFVFLVLVFLFFWFFFPSDLCKWKKWDNILLSKLCILNQRNLNCRYNHLSNCKSHHQYLQLRIHRLLFGCLFDVEFPIPKVNRNYQCKMLCH